MEDTYALYRYAARCLLPATVAAGAKRGKAGGGGAAAAAAEAPPAPPFRAGDWRAGSDGACVEAV